jgi:hypothetical protein
MTMNAESVVQSIREAFADVRKGSGIGLREAIAIDDWATPEEQARARAKDTEEHWWNLVEDAEEDLQTALTFTDREGFKFLLPAAMCSELDESYDGYLSAYFHLVLRAHPPTSNSYASTAGPQYTEYLRSIHPRDTVEYFGFTEAQVHAIALFLKWIDRDQGRDKELEAKKVGLEHAKKEGVPVKWEDEVNNYDEERRIFHEWLHLGHVPFP